MGSTGVLAVALFVVAGPMFAQQRAARTIAWATSADGGVGFAHSQAAFKALAD